VIQRTRKGPWEQEKYFRQQDGECSKVKECDASPRKRKKKGAGNPEKINTTEKERDRLKSKKESEKCTI